MVRPIPECAWTPGARTGLAVLVTIESATGNDAAAIAWTMARRWLAMGRQRGRSFAEYLYDTSAPLRRLRLARRVLKYRGLEASVAGQTPHQRLTLAETWEVHQHGADGDRVRATLEAWSRGEVPDPCESPSFQWFSPWWRPRGRGVERVMCGDTSNRFFTTPRVSMPVLLARLDDPVDARTCR